MDNWFYWIALACSMPAFVTGDTSEKLPPDTDCEAALRLFPLPDIWNTINHLGNSCPELCRNSSGHFSVGKFPHLTIPRAWISCLNDSTWLHWCDAGSSFNESSTDCEEVVEEANLTETLDIILMQMIKPPTRDSPPTRGHVDLRGRYSES